MDRRNFIKSAMGGILWVLGICAGQAEASVMLDEARQKETQAKCPLCKNRCGSFVSVKYTKTGVFYHCGYCEICFASLPDEPRIWVWPREVINDKRTVRTIQYIGDIEP